MTDVKRITYWLALIALAVWGVVKAVGYYQVHSPNRNHPMISELQDMQTYCVGNYLIDLPRGSEPIRLETTLDGNRSATLISWPGISRQEFLRRLDKRWSEIKDITADGTTVFDQPSQRFEVIPDGVLITSRHYTMNLEAWPGGGSGPKSFYETEAFLWREGTLYVFSSEVGKEGVINAMKSLQVRKEDEIPVGKGFCGGMSFFPGKPEANDYIWFAYRLPVEPHTEFRIKLPAIRPPHPDLTLFESDQIKVKKLRDAQRKIAGVTGEEQIEYVWHNRFDGVYETSLAAAWFGAGPEEFGFPGVQMKLDTTSKAESASPPKVGEMVGAERGEKAMNVENLIALWDGITATLRQRPGAF